MKLVRVSEPTKQPVNTAGWPTPPLVPTTRLVDIDRFTLRPVSHVKGRAFTPASPNANHLPKSPVHASDFCDPSDLSPTAVEGLGFTRESNEVPERADDVGKEVVLRYVDHDGQTRIAAGRVLHAKRYEGCVIHNMKTNEVWRFNETGSSEYSQHTITVLERWQAGECSLPEVAYAPEYEQKEGVFTFQMGGRQIVLVGKISRLDQERFSIVDAQGFTHVLPYDIKRWHGTFAHGDLSSEANRDLHSSITAPLVMADLSPKSRRRAIKRLFGGPKWAKQARSCEDAAKRSATEVGRVIVSNLGKRMAELLHETGFSSLAELSTVLDTAGGHFRKAKNLLLKEKVRLVIYVNPTDSVIDEGFRSFHEIPNSGPPLSREPGLREEAEAFYSNMPPEEYAKLDLSVRPKYAVILPADGPYPEWMESFGQPHELSLEELGDWLTITPGDSLERFARSHARDTRGKSGSRAVAWDQLMIPWNAIDSSGLPFRLLLAPLLAHQLAKSSWGVPTTNVPLPNGFEAFEMTWAPCEPPVGMMGDEVLSDYIEAQIHRPFDMASVKKARVNDRSYPEYFDRLIDLGIDVSEPK